MRSTCLFTAGGLIVVSAALIALAPGRSPAGTFAGSSAPDYADTTGDRLPQVHVPSTEHLLREVAQLSDADWLTVQGGGVIAKNLDADSREVAVVGAVRIRGARDLLVARYRDIDTLTRNSLILGAGRFSAAPVASDLSPLVFEEHSLDLRNCRPGDCHVRLSAEAIDRFHREVGWSRADWRNQSASVWREVLASSAGAYLAGGREALPVYVNKAVPLSVASELSLLLPHYRFVEAYSPTFHEYLQEFGSGVPASAEQTLFWTKTDFGIRPVVRISHQVIHRENSAVTLVATNQVYGDHYLDAALSVTLAVDVPGRSPPAFDVLVVSRTRTRSLRGLFRRVARMKVQSRSRDMMRQLLTRLQVSIEQSDRSDHEPGERVFVTGRRSWALPAASGVCCAPLRSPSQ